MDIFSLLPNFGSFAFTLIAFVIAMSLIVAIHEFGHYIVGRWSGIHADVFSLGFGPVLFSRFDKRGTKWQVAALPFGGYVKFRGDADPASASAQKMDHQSEEFKRSTMVGAPLWARSATVFAGPLFNFLFSIALFAGILLYQGTTKLPLTVSQIEPVPFDHTMQVGDVLIEVEGNSLRDGQDGFSDLPKSQTLSYVVERNKRLVEVTGPSAELARVVQVMPRSAAAEAGLQEGDVIVTANAQDITVFSDLKTIVEGSDGAPIDVAIWRDGVMQQIVLTPKRVDEQRPDGSFAKYWRIGIVGGTFPFEFETETAPVTQAIGNATQMTYEIMKGSLTGLYHVITGAISSCNLSGPIGIAETSGQMARQGSLDFLWFIAILSTAVGFINLFPIPILDGGHLSLYAWEAVAGKPPSERILNRIMTVGLFIVLSFMIFAVTNDLFCP